MEGMEDEIRAIICDNGYAQYGTYFASFDIICKNKAWYPPAAQRTCTESSQWLPKPDMYYSFNEADGAKLPGTPVYGDTVGTLKFEQAVLGQGLHLNEEGTSDIDYVNLGNQRDKCFGNLNICFDGLTMAFWVKFPGWTFTTPLDQYYIVTSGAYSAESHGVFFGMKSTEFRAWFKTTSTWYQINHPITNFSADVWYHIGVTFTLSDGPTLYINGTEPTYTVTSRGSRSDSAHNDFVIGSPSNSAMGASLFRAVCVIDELVAWHKVLDLEDVFSAARGPPDCSGSGPDYSDQEGVTMEGYSGEAIQITCISNYVQFGTNANPFNVTCGGSSGTMQWEPAGDGQICDGPKCVTTTQNTNHPVLVADVGTSYTVTCNEGYIHAYGAGIGFANYTTVRQTQYTTSCQADLTWTSVIDCVATPCFLSTPPNHEDNIRGIYLKNLITVACATGYITTNDPINTPTTAIDFSNYRDKGYSTYITMCTADGTIDNVQTCTETPCFAEQPPNTQGTANMEGYYTDILTIGCNEGYITSVFGLLAITNQTYKQIGLSYYPAECTSSGDWNMTYGCRRIPCFHVAPNFTETGDMEGVYEQSFTVTCESGYITHPDDPNLLDEDNYRTDQITNYTATCQADGDWSKTSDCVPTWCNEPGPMNTEYEGDTLVTRYLWYWPTDCNDGYITAPTGHGSITLDNYRDVRIYYYQLLCEEWGEYEPYLNCTPTPCKSPAPANTTLLQPLEGYLNDVLEVTCIFGHVTSIIVDPDDIDFENYWSVMVTAYNTTCGTDGEWNYTRPCRPVPCHANAPAGTQGGRIRGYFQDVFDVVCDVGHITTSRDVPLANMTYMNYRQLRRPSYNCTCQHDGTWDYVEICVKTPCYTPEPEGTVSGDLNMLYQDTMQVNCKYGYITHAENGPQYVVQVGYVDQAELFYQAECLPTGEWDITWTCERIPCRTNTPENCEEVYMDERFGDEAAVECVAGYRDPDNPANRYYITRCQGDGQWSNLRACKSVNCSAIYIDGSDAFGTFTSYQNSVTVRCNDGLLSHLTIEPSFTMRCQEDGTYDSPQTCEKFTCDNLIIENSNVTNATILVQTSLLAECHPGYKTDDLTQTFLVKCTMELLWENVQNCSRITSEPLTIQRTAASNWVRLFADIVTLTCEAGYQFTSGRTELVLQVQADGSWNDTDSCQPVQCNIPGPANTLLAELSAEYPKVKLVQCNEGYETADGKSDYITQCTVNGTWDRLEPCQAKPCLGKPAAQYKLTADIPARYFGDTHEAHCLPGYVLYNGDTSQNLTCNSRGKWGALKCSAVKCPVLAAEHSNGAQSTGQFGTRLNVTCDTTFMLPGGGRMYPTECQNNKRWTQDIDCIKIRCPPIVLPLTNINGYVLEAGQSIIGRCHTGYAAAGGIVTEITVRCNQDGVVVQGTLQCELIPCPTMRVLNSNIESGIQGVYGDVVNVVCDVGYMIDNAATNISMMCQSDGTWHPQVTCPAISCPWPTLDASIRTANRTLVPQPQPFGQRVEFVCQDGYSSIQGDETSECLYDGTWTQIPFCWKNCEPLHPPTNGRLSNELRKSNTVVLFHCHAGFDRVGADRTTCSTSGQWSHPPPLCKYIPVDGVWGQWETWTECTQTCSTGTRGRTRYCHPPLHGGTDCAGNSTASEACNTVPCQVDGYMSAWSEWTVCELSVGDCTQGTRTHTQTCVPPRHGGAPCELPQRTQVEECTLECEEGDGSTSGLTAEELAAANAATQETLAADNRRSAQLAGAVSITFICLVTISIIALDATTIVMKMEKKRSVAWKLYRVPSADPCERNLPGPTLMHR